MYIKVMNLRPSNNVKCLKDRMTDHNAFFIHDHDYDRKSITK